MFKKSLTAASVALAAASLATAANITVDPASTAQKIVGFGAGAARNHLLLHRSSQNHHFLI